MLHSPRQSARGLIVLSALVEKEKKGINLEKCVGFTYSQRSALGYSMDHLSSITMPF